MINEKVAYLKIVTLILFVAIAGFCYSCSRGQALEVSSLATVELSPSQSSEVLISEAETAVPEQEVCYVHICGEVNNPGVYEMEEGQRIYQVVERAGGYTDAAAADYLNLAGVVSDGMKLIVPKMIDVQQENGMVMYESDMQDQSGAKSGKVNLNTASKEVLMSLRGIGEARAEDIMRYREEQGGFDSIEEIMNIPGIKNAAFEKIKDNITV